MELGPGVELNGDITVEALQAEMAGRAVRAYPALVSTEAAALAWARSGAPGGAVVVAGYQASPRGRAGLPWQTRPGRDLGFSLVLRPDIPAAREGWTYTGAVCGLADALGEDVMIRWPDEVWRRGERVGALGAWIELGPGEVRWAVVNVFVPDAPLPRTPLLARVADAIEARFLAAPEEVLHAYRSRCWTIGRRVQARMIPLGPAGPRVEGIAVGLLADGSLLIATDAGRRVAVRPQNLGLLDDLGAGF